MLAVLLVRCLKSFVTLEQYDAFVRFSQDQIEKKLSEAPLSCKYVCIQLCVCASMPVCQCASVLLVDSVQNFCAIIYSIWIWGQYAGIGLHKNTQMTAYMIYFFNSMLYYIPVYKVELSCNP